MPINVNDPEYVSAEKAYHDASSLEERLNAIRKMISHAPKHKGGENLRKQLTTRRKKLEEQITKAKKSGKSSKVGIKKEDMQIVIVGETNSGKSTLLKLLTNTHPEIADYNFTTKHPIIGMMNYATVPMQLIEIPAVESEYFDRGTTNTADTVLLLITKIEEISQIRKYLENARGKQIIVFNKSELLSKNEKRKISATLQSKKHNFVLISAKTNENIEELKNKIFQSFDKIRVYTKEPKKEKTKKPIILKPNSTVKDVAEKILKGFSEKVKESKIWGPSSKFPGQKIGLSHKLKDLDVVEFKTK